MIHNQVLLIASASRQIGRGQTIRSNRRITWAGHREDLLASVAVADQAAMGSAYLACRYGALHLQGHVAATMTGYLRPCEWIFTYLPRSRNVHCVCRRGAKDGRDGRGRKNLL